jgi:hypothetical protein
MTRNIDHLFRKDIACVEITVVHPTLDPDFISELLALEPYHVMVKGETVYESERHHIRADATYWSFRSPSNLKDRYADAHLLWLLDKFFGKIPSIRKLQALGAELRLTCHIETWSGVGILHFEGDLLQRMAQIQFSSVNFRSIYKRLSDDEEEDDDYDDEDCNG